MNAFRDLVLLSYTSRREREMMTLRNDAALRAYVKTRVADRHSQKVKYPLDLLRRISVTEDVVLDVRLSVPSLRAQEDIENCRLRVMYTARPCGAAILTSTCCYKITAIARVDGGFFCRDCDAHAATYAPSFSRVTSSCHDEHIWLPWSRDSDDSVYDGSHLLCDVCTRALHLYRKRHDEAVQNHARLRHPDPTGVKFLVAKAASRRESPLSCVYANALVLSEIFRRVDEWYRGHIDDASVAYCVLNIPPVTFPPLRGVRVNMMPIDLLKLPETLPENCLPYKDIIKTCFSAQRVRHFRESFDPHRPCIAYVSIDESDDIPVGRTQRRSGLHIERPKHGGVGVKDNGGTATWEGLAGWGLGYFHLFQDGCDTRGYPVDGIYMASNVTGSCTIYPTLIRDPSADGVTDAHGGIEHFRGRLGAPRTLQAGQVCWFTDRTPHENVTPPPSLLPAEAVAKGTYRRQFFRLVMGPISVWHARHNTPNPCGLQPAAPVTYDDKFDDKHIQTDEPKNVS